MVKKQLRLGMYSAIILVALSVLSLAVFNSIYFEDGSSALTVWKDETAQVNISVNSFEPYAPYSVDLYDSTNTLVTNLESGTTVPDDIGGGFYSNVLDVTPWDRNYEDGTFTIKITSNEDGNPAVDEITLDVLNFVPVFSGLPDVYLDENQVKKVFNLEDYVYDFDDNAIDFVWTVSGNTNMDVEIADWSEDYAVTITPNNNFEGTNTLTFTVTDASGDSQSDTITVTVGDGTPGDDNNDELSVKNVGLEFFGLDMLKIRNPGKLIEDLRIEINVEGADVQPQIFKLDLERNRVVYKQLDFEGLEPGVYLSKIQLTVDDEDAKVSHYTLIEKD